MFQRLRRRGDERGANLVEFALVAPLLFALLFGMVEFGWAFAQNLDVKHTAREAGRLAAVNATEAEIIDRVCNNDLLNPDFIQEISRTPTGTLEVGDSASLTVSADLQQITGMFGWALSSVSPLSSTVDFRIEQETDAWDGSNLASCP